jgi:hypothetical protein
VRINCRWNTPSPTNGPHHDRGSHATARMPSSRRSNQGAVAGSHVRLPTPSTMRAAAAPEKARPRRESTVATASIKWPSPLLSKEDPRAARALGSNKYDPRRVQTPTSGLEARLKQTGATGALNTRETTDQRLENWRGQGPLKPADAKDGSTQLLPRTALLIRGSKPDPRRVRTGAPDHQSQGRRGHVHSSLSSSPPAQGCPTCHVRELARAASQGDPTEGELPRPRSLANGTEPHLANPRKCFDGRVSGPRSLSLSNGAWASTRTTH